MERLIALIDRNTLAIERLADEIAQQNRARRSISRTERDRIIAAHKATCIYCASAMLREECVLDHVVPLALGGADVEENLAVACVGCNTRKGAKKVDEAFPGGWVWRDCSRWYFQQQKEP